MLPSLDATAIVEDENTLNYAPRFSYNIIHTVADCINACELSDPSYQAKASAPSTCNTIHELGFSLCKMKFLSNEDTKQ